jgi:hypothetical protein
LTGSIENSEQATAVQLKKFEAMRAVCSRNDLEEPRTGEALVAELQKMACGGPLYDGSHSERTHSKCSDASKLPRYLRDVIGAISKYVSTAADPEQE